MTEKAIQRKSVFFVSGLELLRELDEVVILTDQSPFGNVSETRNIAAIIETRKSVEGRVGASVTSTAQFVEGGG